MHVELGDGKVVHDTVFSILAVMGENVTDTSCLLLAQVYGYYATLCQALVVGDRWVGIWTAADVRVRIRTSAAGAMP